MTQREKRLNLVNSFRDWWALEAYPSRFAGVVYEFDATGRDARAASRLLRAMRWDEGRARAVAIEYLHAPVFMLTHQDRPLRMLGDQMRFWIGWASARRAKGIPSR